MTPSAVRLLRAKRGQIATFLTLCMALGLMLVMVSTNVGKVAMFRTNTSNAADAGALAAASWLASTDNKIAELSTRMFARYLVHVVTQALTVFRPYSMPLLGYGVDLLFNGTQFVQYVRPAIRVGEQGHDHAESDARTFAQANSGMGSQEEGSFSVQVGDVPTPSPVPMVGPVVFFSCIPPCQPGFATCYCCTPYCYVTPPLRFPDVVLSFVSDIDDGEGTVDVSATRTQPDADLRLWRMRYGAVTSGASGWYGGGSPMPFSGEKYESKLDSVQ